ncbi:hypothetical protein NE237_015497 [Protea cynaroides]|uniref:Uncharacterized protein n=1 Tax=Protea cynaroides TaxID=273540 RepID=A0A9Q0KED3_9MAGN|nr:hypothetical protein NE237_015497 [Protea cynaroides]
MVSNMKIMMQVDTSKSASVEIDSKLEQMNDFAGLTTDVSITRMNSSVLIDTHVESKEEQSNFPELVTVQLDSSSISCSGPIEIAGIERIGSFTNSESDASGKVDTVHPSETLSETVDGNNVKAKPNEKIAALSIPTVKPAESCSDITTNDCIDHGSGTSGGHYEVTKNMEDYPKSLVPDGDHSRCSEPDEGEVCSAQRVTTSPDDGSNGSKALGSDMTSTHTEQLQIVCSIKNQEIFPERPIVIHERGGVANVSSAYIEVDKKKIL